MHKFSQAGFWGDSSVGGSYQRRPQVFKFLFSKAFIFQIILALVVFALGFFLLDKFLKTYTNFGESIEVPSVVGLTYEQLQQHLESKHLGYEIIDSTYISGKPAWMILDQNPKAGQKVKENRVIYLTVNAKKPPKTEIPDLVGKSSLKFAKIQLQSRGLKVGELVYKPNPDLNAVLEMQIDGKEVLPGEMIPKGTTVDLVLGNGLGSSRVDVPRLIGLTLEEAEFVVQSNSLNIGAILYDGEITDTAAARVYKQMPAHTSDGNLIRLGEPVDLFFREWSEEEIRQDSVKISQQDSIATDDSF